LDSNEREESVRYNRRIHYDQHELYESCELYDESTYFVDVILFCVFDVSLMKTRHAKPVHELETSTLYHVKLLIFNRTFCCVRREIHS